MNVPAVARAELLEIRLALREPFVTRSGSRRDRRILLLRVESADGLAGWSECVAGEDASYTSETVDTAWEILTEQLLPGLPGAERMGGGARESESAPARGVAPVRGSDADALRAHPMARATVDMALWDVAAKAEGIPLGKFLGGSTEPVRVGAVLGIQRDLPALVERAGRLLARGYARVKLKIEPGWDAAPLEAVRAAFPEAVLGVDANGSYASDRAGLRAVSALDRFRPAMIEQPFPAADLEGHARLQERVEAPVALDESLDSAAATAAALDLGACRAVNVKPGRVGGLSEAVAIHDLCRAAGIPVFCGGMLETGIGRAHALALASLPRFTIPPDLSESARYWERDIVIPEFALEDGRLIPVDRPGIGVEPDVDRIRELAVRSRAFE